MLFKTEAFVLKNNPLSEADRLYTLFTPQEGIIKALLKSAAKSNSKQAGHLPIFGKVKVMIVRGKIDRLAGVNLINDFSNLRCNIKNISLAYSIIELYINESSGFQKLEEFYLLENILSILDNKLIVLEKKVLLARIFLWKYLSISGWKPELDKCVICSNEVNNSNYLPGHGIICTKHDNNQKVNISNSLRILLKFIIESNWLELIDLNVNKELNKEWLKISQLFYQSIYEKPLKSLKVFNYG